MISPPLSCAMHFQPYWQICYHMNCLTAKASSLATFPYSHCPKSPGVGQYWGWVSSFSKIGREQCQATAHICVIHTHTYVSATFAGKVETFSPGSHCHRPHAPQMEISLCFPHKVSIPHGEFPLIGRPKYALNRLDQATNHLSMATDRNKTSSPYTWASSHHTWICLNCDFPKTGYSLKPFHFCFSEAQHRHLAFNQAL